MTARKTSRKCPQTEDGHHVPVTSPGYDGYTADGKETHTYCSACLTPLEEQ